MPALENKSAVPDSLWRLSVAPMMDWTDRHCRYFHRLLSRHALLYTEMVTTGALIHGDQPRHLDFDPAEHPLDIRFELVGLGGRLGRRSVEVGARVQPGQRHGVRGNERQLQQWRTYLDFLDRTIGKRAEPKAD